MLKLSCAQCLERALNENDDTNQLLIQCREDVKILEQNKTSLRELQNNTTTYVTHSLIYLDFPTPQDFYMMKNEIMLLNMCRFEQNKDIDISSLTMKEARERLLCHCEIHLWYSCH